METGSFPKVRRVIFYLRRGFGLIGYCTMELLSRTFPRESAKGTVITHKAAQQGLD